MGWGLFYLCPESRSLLGREMGRKDDRLCMNHRSWDERKNGSWTSPALPRANRAGAHEPVGFMPTCYTSSHSLGARNPTGKMQGTGNRCQNIAWSAKGAKTERPQEGLLHGG